MGDSNSTLYIHKNNFFRSKVNSVPWHVKLCISFCHYRCFRRIKLCVRFIPRDVSFTSKYTEIVWQLHSTQVECLFYNILQNSVCTILYTKNMNNWIRFVQIIKHIAGPGCFWESSVVLRTLNIASMAMYVYVFSWKGLLLLISQK